MTPTAIGLRFVLIGFSSAVGMSNAPIRPNPPTMPTEVAKGPPLRALIVGGGPDLKHNQVAIESNVRYVHRLLPTGTPARILFTDGNPESKNVQYLGKDNSELYRKPQLPQLDGPANLATVKSELYALAQLEEIASPAPVLLYFTGHGDPDYRSGYANNNYDLWKEESLNVRTLAASIAKFPSNAPITLVMVECFSGAFGNLLFEKGDPKGALADRPICGFFASLDQRIAAGCTPEVNEADYHDFTGYFFAALTGKDRLGRTLTGADYNGDGKIGMNEAFDYALLHDNSIDTPVCTSDVFLRRFVTTPDKEIFATPYSQVRQWGTKGQVAALDGLSTALNLTGETRLQTSYDRAMRMKVDSDDIGDVRTIRFVRLGKSIVLAHTIRSSSDTDLKSRFEALIKAESANPFKP